MHQDNEGTCLQSAAADGATSLPCLSSVNCDKGRADLTPAQRKTAHALAANVSHFVETYGVENVGFLTITFGGKLDWKEAQRRFHNYARRVLSKWFGDYIRVLEFQRNGNPHYHLVVACPGDIATGFNWTHYEAVRDWYGNGRKGRRPRGNLGRTELLTRIHAELLQTAMAYRIGRMELVPIRTCAEAIGRYVGGYLQKGLAGKKPEHKRARSVCYSRGFQRAYNGRFSWVEGKSREWRAKVAAWAQKHGCTDLIEVLGLFGPKWAYHHRESIEKTEIPTNENHTRKRDRGDVSGPHIVAGNGVLRDGLEVRGRRSGDDAVQGAGDGSARSVGQGLGGGGGEVRPRRVYTLKPQEVMTCQQPTLFEASIRARLRELRGIDEPF